VVIDCGGGRRKWLLYAVRRNIVGDTYIVIPREAGIPDGALITVMWDVEEDQASTDEEKDRDNKIADDDDSANMCLGYRPSIISLLLQFYKRIKEVYGAQSTCLKEFLLDLELLFDDCPPHGGICDEGDKSEPIKCVYCWAHARRAGMERHND